MLCNAKRASQTCVAFQNLYCHAHFQPARMSHVLQPPSEYEIPQTVWHATSFVAVTIKITHNMNSGEKDSIIPGIKVLTVFGSHSSDGCIPVLSNSSVQGRLQNVASAAP